MLMCPQGSTSSGCSGGLSAKCTVCDKTCGSVLRLQDWRCLWCKAMVSARRGGPGGSWGREGLAPPVTRRRTLQVHTACKDSLVTKCPLGLCKVSVIPPTALNSIDSDGGYRALLSQPFPRIAFSGELEGARPIASTLP